MPIKLAVLGRTQRLAAFDFNSDTDRTGHTVRLNPYNFADAEDRQGFSMSYFHWQGQYQFQSGPFVGSKIRIEK